MQSVSHHIRLRVGKELTVRVQGCMRDESRDGRYRTFHELLFPRIRTLASENDDMGSRSCDVGSLIFFRPHCDRRL
jgi:hypothetical protein